MFTPLKILYTEILGYVGIEDIKTIETKVTTKSIKAPDSDVISTKQTKTKLVHIVRWRLFTDSETKKGILSRDDIDQNTPMLMFCSTIVYIISFFLCYLVPIPVGHLCTRVGRCIWSIVIRKYWIFLKVCLGIWTDECIIAYNLRDERLLRIDDEIDVGEDNAHKHEHLTDEQLKAQLHEIRSKKNEDDAQTKRFSLNTEKEDGSYIFEERDDDIESGDDRYHLL